MSRQGTVNDWRNDLLEVAGRSEAPEYTKYEWITGNDEVVCPKCARRDGKLFTYKQLVKELDGEFCCPGDPDDRCRCTVIVAEVNLPSTRSKKSAGKNKSKSGCLAFFLVVPTTLWGAISFIGST